MEAVANLITIISGIITAIAASIAIYVFFTKKEVISSAIQLLLNYAHQLSLAELKEKLERINDHNVNSIKEKEKVIFILNEITGQIKGNKQLNLVFNSKINEIDKLLMQDGKNLTEPRKRSLVAELRENIRHINVENIDKFIGEKK